METPPFDEAVADFARFLREQGESGDLAWAFREDVTHDRRACWIREPLPAGNPAAARRHFESGRRAGFGVTLEMFCRLGGRSGCFIWVPRDRIDAEYAMQSPLKLKAVINPVDAAPVRSGLRWWIVRARNRLRGRDHLSARLPSRRPPVARVQAG